MHRRSPVRIGFCVSFPVGSVLALGSMISTQAMPGVTVVFLYLAVVWFVLYAACGALPYLAAGAEKRMVAAAFWGFGIGGAAAGELVAILVMSDNLASHARVLEHSRSSDNSVAAVIPHDALASCRLGVDQTGSHELDCARPVGSCRLSSESACCRFTLRTRHNSETR